MSRVGSEGDNNRPGILLAHTDATPNAHVSVETTPKEATLLSLPAELQQMIFAYVRWQ
jgi:hypothetical protein